MNTKNFESIYRLIKLLLYKLYKNNIKELIKNDLPLKLSEFIADERYESLIWDNIRGVRDKFDSSIIEIVITKLLNDGVLKLSKNILYMNEDSLSFIDTRYLSEKQDIAINKLVHEFIVLETKPLEEKIGNVRVYRKIPNDFYTITTSDTKDGFISKCLFSPLPKEFIAINKIIHWDLITDGAPHYDNILWDSLTSDRRHYNHPDDESKWYDVQSTRGVTVKGADFVITQGYVGNSLRSSRLYTLLDGEPFNKAVALSNQKDIGLNLTDKRPSVKIIKYNNN